MHSIYKIVNLSIPTEMWEFFLGGHGRWQKHIVYYCFVFWSGEVTL